MGLFYHDAKMVMITGSALHYIWMLGVVIASLRSELLSFVIQKFVFLFHWIDGMRHKFYRATGLGCRGYTALEGEYHEELGFIYSTDFTYSYLTV